MAGSVIMYFCLLMYFLRDVKSTKSLSIKVPMNVHQDLLIIKTCVDKSPCYISFI